MNILSIDTSSQLLSIALVKNDTLIEESYSSDKKHSENIIPLLKNLMDKSDINFSSLSGITFGAGPGAFTGVRIAAGVAYGIAYAHNLPIVGINNFREKSKYFFVKGKKNNFFAFFSQNKFTFIFRLFSKND